MTHLREEVSSREIRPLQRARETSQRWVHLRPIRWTTRNGLALGFGATSRIGFWLWYAVPAGAFLVGSPGLGAAIYGMYGLVRGIGAWGIIVGNRAASFNFADRLSDHLKAARVLAAGQLVTLGIAVAIIVGL